MREYHISLLPGDGIGPEVVAEAVKVLRAVGRRFRLGFQFVEAIIGGAAVDTVGVPLPEETLTACRASQAILLGAVGGPRWDHLPGEQRPERGLLQLRKSLEVFANLRPVRRFPVLADVAPLRAELMSEIDLLIVRELTSGLYFGTPRGRTGEEAVDTLRYTKEEIARVVRVALRAARERQRRLTSVDKANVLESSRLWREVVEEERQAFPDVAVEHMLVDTCAMNLIRTPAAFDVIVTENMFGDILSDEAGALVGSLGILPSASIGEHPPFLYEPVHGTAPGIAGRGIANPIGAILSAAMMLRFSFASLSEAAAVETAVDRVVEDGGRTADLGGATMTAEFGDRVAAAIEALEPEPAEQRQ